MIGRFADCEGCARRRAAFVEMGRRMADWIKRPVGPKPLDISSSARPQVPTDPIIEARALALFFAENPGATENDWRCATDGLRSNYRAAVQAKMEVDR